MSQCGNCGGTVSEGARFCPSCGSRLPDEPSAVEQAPVPEKAPAGYAGKIVVALLLLLGLGVFVASLIPSTHEVIRRQPVIAGGEDYGPVPVTMTRVDFAVRGDDLVFSLNDLKQNRLIRFGYAGGKTPRSVLAYVAPDGRLVTAISLSEHCGSTEFELVNNQIHCTRCGSRWDMMTMEAYSCCAQYYPDPIPSRVEGNEVRVSREVVENWAGRL